MKIWTKEQKTALGLNEKESKLLDVLNARGPLNTSALAYDASLPRVTTMRVLKSLKDRGFVTRKEDPRAVVWSLLNPVLLEKRFTRLFADSHHLPRHSVDLSEVGSLTVYRGIEAMLESNRKMLVAHEGERLLAIEPNGIWKHFGLQSADEWKHINLLFKQRRILVEIVVEEGFAELLKSEVDPGVEETFLSLAVDIRVVPAGVLDSSTEILIFRDQVLFMDWAHLVAVEIKNPSTVRVMRAMYRMMQESGNGYTKRSQ